MIHQSHITELLPAYALGCLEESEAAEVRAHLAECPVCRRELRLYEETAAELAFVPPAAAPPPQLKQRVLDAAARKKGDEEARPSAKPGWRQWLQGWFRPQWILATSALALIALLLVSNIALWQRLRVLEQEYEQLNDLHTVTLAGTEAAPQAHAILIAPKDGMEGALVVDHLPLLDSAHAYQLWLVDESGQRVSGGVFVVNKEGYATLTIKAPRPLKSYKTFGVTVEPAEGSPGPTGPKVLGSA